MIGPNRYFGLNSKGLDSALYPRFKWQYFQEQWQANVALRPYLAPTKSKFKRRWENKYKSETIREGQSPEPEPEIRAPIKPQLSPGHPNPLSNANHM
jgi:hypothetical protein